MNSGASQFKVNDGSFSSSLNNGAWRSLSFTGTLSKLTVKGDSPQTFGNFAPRLSAIRIDGSVILTDPVTRNGDVSATTFNSFTTDIDTVRGQETAYATLNPLDNSQTLSNGNLSVTGISGNWRGTRGTIGMSSGKFYWEWSIGFTNSGSNQSLLGIAQASAVLSNNYASVGAYGWEYYSNGQKFHNTSNVSYGDAYTIGDVIGASFDADNGKLTFYKNGVSQGEAYNSLISGPYYPSSSLYGTSLVELNFGQKPFKYAPPAGFQPLNGDSIRPETVIPRSDHYVGVKLYTGTGSNKSLTGLAFQSDFVWIKTRNEDENNFLVDSVRGVTEQLYANLTDNEYTNANRFKSFDSNGFTVGTTDDTNQSGNSFVAWCWKAGGNKNTFNVDDVGYASAADAGFATGGSNITPTAASVGTKQGFSIVTWDVGSLNGTLSLNTGLTQAPEFVITKVLDHNDDWLTFHKDISSTESFILNGNRAKLSNAAYAHTFNSDGTISGLVVPNWWIANKSYVFYSWHSVPGLQKFGSYEANNSADGPFIELGFRPSILWVKRADATGSWYILDNKRDEFNNTYKTLSPNQSGIEDVVTGASGYCDFLSNGFKPRIAEGSINGTNTYVYCAWAEAPTVNLFGAQSNAR